LKLNSTTSHLFSQQIETGFLGVYSIARLRASLPSSGKRDLLFPFLPRAARERFQLDSVANYSVTDQFHARASTELVSLAFLVLMTRDEMDAPPPSESVDENCRVAESDLTGGAADDADEHSGDESNASDEEVTSAAAGTACASSAADSGRVRVRNFAAIAAATAREWRQRLCSSGFTAPAAVTDQAAVDMGLLSPAVPFTFDLCAVDSMACVGGNTISLAAAFRRTLAFEIDAVRAGLLRDNLQLVSDLIRENSADAASELVSYRRLPQCRTYSLATVSRGCWPRAAAICLASSTSLPAHCRWISSF
jgi:hypothetical protein